MIHKRLVILDNDDLKEMISRYINVAKEKLDIKVEFSSITGEIKFNVTFEDKPIVTFEDKPIVFKIGSDELIKAIENVNQLHKMEKGEINLKRQ